jgi:hypothetical protein
MQTAQLQPVPPSEVETIKVLGAYTKARKPSDQSNFLLLIMVMRSRLPITDSSVHGSSRAKGIVVMV